MDLNEERRGLEKKFFELCQVVVRQCGFVLYDLDYIVGQKTLRLYIMNEQTKTALVEDCVAVDRAMTPYFESETWMPAEVTLEVSSPGAERYLRRLEHFEWVVGKKISLVLFKSLGDIAGKELPKSLKGAKKVVATLLSVSAERLEIEAEENQVLVPFDVIKKANLEFDMDQIDRKE